MVTALDLEDTPTRRERVDKRRQLRWRPEDVARSLDEEHRHGDLRQVSRAQPLRCDGLREIPLIAALVGAAGRCRFGPDIAGRAGGSTVFGQLSSVTSRKEGKFCEGKLRLNLE